MEADVGSPPSYPWRALALFGDYGDDDAVVLPGSRPTYAARRSASRSALVPVIRYGTWRQIDRPRAASVETLDRHQGPPAGAELVGPDAGAR